MAEIVGILNSLWGLVLGVIAFIVWLARLDFGVAANRKRSEDLERRLEELEGRIEKNQTEAQQARAAMELELKEMRKEMNNGFKEIIFRLPTRGDKD